MSKPYWSGPSARAGSGFVDDDSHRDGAPTGRISSPDAGDYRSGFYSSGGYRTTEEYRASQRQPGSDDYDNGDYDDHDDFEYCERDTRWRVVAGMAVAVLLAAVVAITLVMRSDEPAPTGQTETSPPATSTAPRTVIATVPPSPAPPPPAQLSPETVVTITTTPSASAAPAPAAPVAPLPGPEVAAAPATDPRAVTYSVTGTRQPIDLVTVIYTDEQGFLRTDVNVALPWNKTVVRNPGVEIESVTATSVMGQLNCAITDPAGAVMVAQNNNSMIATCTG